MLSGIRLNSTAQLVRCAMANVSSLRYEPVQSQPSSTVRSRSRLSLLSAQQISDSSTFRKLTPAPLLRSFHLDEIGVDTRQFVADLAPTFDGLPLDFFDVAIRQVKFLQQFASEVDGKADELSTFKAKLRDLEADPFNFESNRRKLLDLARLLPDAHFLGFSKIGPVRTRSIARFEVSVDGFMEVTINRVPAGQFVQYGLPVGDLRAHARSFSEAKPEVTQHPGFVRLIEFVVREIAKTISAWSPTGRAVRSFAVTLHQMCFMASPEDPFILPDGVHQDGVDYIVSALPIVLDGIKAPVSTVYNLDKVPVFQRILNVGEALFHDDRGYWHGISAIHASGPRVGRRGILGLDISVER